VKNTMNTSVPVIEARNLQLVFQTNDGPVDALKDVNLTVNRGDFVSFIGPSGCGKTTFLRAIAASEQPTGGSLTVNGITPDETQQCCAHGYVFKAKRRYLWRTIAAQHRPALGNHRVFQGQTERARGMVTIDDEIKARNRCGQFALHETRSAVNRALCACKAMNAPRSPANTVMSLWHECPGLRQVLRPHVFVRGV
jgi:ABC-type glutathione transport system ATPase component